MRTLLYKPRRWVRRQTSFKPAWWGVPMPNLVPDILPVAIVLLGFVAGFYVRHQISLKRQKNAKNAFFKQI
jgi:hypothetical protein